MKAFLISLSLLLHSSYAIAEINKNSKALYSPFDFLYARHDDDRLVRMACARALKKDAEGAFYLGAVLSDRESLYFNPETGLLWLSLAEKWGYRFADSYIDISFPLISLTAVAQIRENIEECINSDFKNCGPNPHNTSKPSLGWPPQTHFYCQKSQKK